MKKMVMVLGFVTILIFSTAYVYALDPGADPGQKGMGERGHFHHKDWGTGKGLSLTPEQKAKFRQMHRDFRRDNAQLIGSLIAKKIELQALWTDPKADSSVIMDKTKELRDVKNQLRDKFIGMRLEARKILTPEQIAHWKSGWMWRPGHRHHHRMGPGRMWRHGHRHGHHMMRPCEMMGHGRMMGYGGMTGRERMREHGWGEWR